MNDKKTKDNAGWEYQNRLNQWELIVAQEQIRRKETINKIDLSERNAIGLQNISK